MDVRPIIFGVVLQYTALGYVPVCVLSLLGCIGDLRERVSHRS